MKSNAKFYDAYSETMSGINKSKINIYYKVTKYKFNQKLFSTPRGSTDVVTFTVEFQSE